MHVRHVRDVAHSDIKDRIYIYIYKCDTNFNMPFQGRMLPSISTEDLFELGGFQSDMDCTIFRGRGPTHAACYNTEFTLKGMLS